MKEVIAIFDIGKTNKKVLLFDENLKVVYQKEEKFEEIKDDDGYPCDDRNLIEKWIKSTLDELSESKEYKIKAVNFSTYGATLMHIDENGDPVTPVYNYLKPMPEEITNQFYPKYGGKEEFSRKTASPALGMLNSGLQVLWLKKTKPEVFNKIKNILHFPQYCSYLVTKTIASEYTSIGCHTAMWDFDNMQYHQWLGEEGISLPEPVSNSKTFEAVDKKYDFVAGAGIHDSSASLAPYILGSDEKFLLLSTGTWSINMNPYNYDPLTREELENDCLAYMSISQKPVKSSRFFLGHIHDVNLERLNAFFQVDKNHYKTVSLDESSAIEMISKKTRFFSKGIPENYVDEEIDLAAFSSFEEAYQQLVIDLTGFLKESVDFIIPKKDDITNIYISGGFARNGIFVRSLATRYKNKKIFTSEIDNATALGAAMVVFDQVGDTGKLDLDLGLQSWEPIN